MLLPSETLIEIEKLYHSRKHMELTIGIRKNGENETVHFGPDRNIAEGEPLIYPVGSICKPFTKSFRVEILPDNAILKL